MVLGFFRSLKEQNTMKIYMFTFLTLLFLAGCVPVGVMQVDRVEFESTPQKWESQQKNSQQNIENLLALTPDGQMHNLVQRALSGNPSLAMTALRLKEAGMLVRQSRAGQLPKLDATLGGSRTKAVNLKPDNNFSAGLILSWEADLWGRLQAATNAEELEQQALAGDLDAARISLAGQVMKTWLTLVSQRRILQLEEARINSFKTAEIMITERYQNGIGSIDDLNASKSTQASATADLNQQWDDYQRTQRLLKTLLGDLPETDFPIPESLPHIHLPAAGLPADTVGRRPDLRAAYQRIKAADQKTVVAYKRLLPGFKLSFDLSDRRNDFSDLLKGSPAWNFLGSMTAPLFNAGQIKAEAKRKEFSAETAFLNYRQILLQAFLEVENGISREGSLDFQQIELSKAEKHADASYKKYQYLYREGMTDIVTLLTTERTAYRARIRRIGAEKERLLNRVDLALALGIGM
jgi:NodT family efflux transporter outer membrane factor (OMF) lipoprotein